MSYNPEPYATKQSEFAIYAMNRGFKDHNEFDKYAWEKGRWAYDNGWRYKDEFFGAAYIREELGRTDMGELNYLLMLREGHISNRTVILHGIGAQLTEIWSGQIESKDDFDKTMIIVNSYIERYMAKKPQT